MGMRQRRDDEVSEQLERLQRAWQAERLGIREQTQAERALTTLRERMARGMAAADLRIEELLPSPGGRLILVLTSSQSNFDRQGMRLRQGDPVRLYHHEPTEAGALIGVVERWRGSGLGVAIEGELPERFEDHPFRLDREAPEGIFDKGDFALRRARDAYGDAAALVDLAYGRGKLERVELNPPAFLDEALDDSQREAVRHALATSPIALVHGPPGTGKTRCLIEIIRQCLSRGERVLAVAASNVAVDNLVERLDAAGVDALRLGHPARVLPELESKTLVARLDQHEGAALAARWVSEATELKRRTERQAARGQGDAMMRREAFAEARRLMRDARHHLRRVEEAIVAQHAVVCATLTGADHLVLRQERFDVVVMDEATQALDPLAWLPLWKAPRAILAGDPLRLPPTVISDEALSLGLGVTIFERLMKRLGDGAVRMLTVQRRMHEDIMRYPSMALYQGALCASPEVAAHSLEDLGLPSDPDRPGARVFIDTAGAGFSERKRDPDGSTCNPEQAEKTAAEVRRLVSRGIALRELAVITPYDAQVNELKSLLQDLVAEGLEIGSIDGFQGREKDAIVLDLVRSNEDRELGFLSDSRRMNVALTRARRFLLVIGDSATLAAHPFYDAFLEDVEVYGSWVSVFCEPFSTFE